MSQLSARDPELCFLLRAGAELTPASGQSAQVQRSPYWASGTAPPSQAGERWGPLSSR